MAAVHFALISLVDQAYVGHFWAAKSLQVIVVASATLLLHCLLRLVIPIWG